MRFASLGSGSEGNALVVQADGGAGGRRTSVLVDCGFGLREAQRRLQALDVAADSLAGILVTHEHGDHVGGVFRLARTHRIPVYLTHGTWQAVAAMPGAAECEHRFIDPGKVFEIDGISIEPVAVPHDAREPVQFVLDSGRSRLGVLTDLGHGTPHVVQAFSGLDAIVLECNHDPDLLAANPRYPPALKRRIGGPYGHLSNAAAAEIAAAINGTRLRRIAAAHLSTHNNRPELARSALATALGASPEDIRVAQQQTGLAWVELGVSMAA
ncbi:MAG: MBL fold metallo-hydrolase [Burkholderiaceae bacterium]|nr:MBL fold metallo-hydrolase [Burkholderiaceae bacterium]MEB2318472.1 MBL fold metallo-hydrolase [Pseudomonadota bacterium]